MDEKNTLLFLEINNKNILLKELYHRVKNNLQIISGILSMQTKRIQNQEAKTLLDETNLRIKAMSMVHEQLYRSDDLEAVNMQAYVTSLVNELLRSFKTDHLRFDIRCERIDLLLEKAVPMGLIINELVTNALKYAFDTTQTQKVITIKMYLLAEDAFILEVSDNGKGFDVTKKSKGFGLRLLESLASYQFKGTIDTFNAQGLHIKITFPKESIS